MLYDFSASFLHVDDVAERATDIYDFYYEESGTNSDKDNVIEFTRAFNDAANILKVFIDITMNLNKLLMIMTIILVILWRNLMMVNI